MKALVIDIGGSHIKVLVIKIPSGPKTTGSTMARDVRSAVADWTYDAAMLALWK